MDAQIAQTLAVATVLLGAVGYLARRVVLAVSASRIKDAGCAGGCGCSSGH
ncbi:MAG: FeoB-associated Cys-rich membrane protein [Gemmatimonadetes bacterium]|nr:FeoB-associated Cys-rich membrane protein [Gemmatimonadota bacterium]